MSSNGEGYDWLGADYLENTPMINVYGGVAHSGANVVQWGMPANGPTNQSLWWTTTDDEGGTVAYTGGSNSNPMTNNGGVVQMLASCDNAWSARWFYMETIYGDILSCCDGTGCVTATPGAADGTQLMVTPYDGSTGQFWTTSPVPGGVFPPVNPADASDLNLTPAFVQFLTTTSSRQNRAGGTMTMSSMLCELWRLMAVADTAGLLEPELRDAIVLDLLFWLTAWDGSRGGYDSGCNAVRNGYDAAVAATTAANWTAVGGLIDDEDYEPPR